MLTITATADASFNVATTSATSARLSAIKKSADVVEVYTNGVKKGTDTLTATETKAKLGDQGQQIEFYENKDGDYRMVVIDTYLAYVNDVVEKKVDSKDHTTRDAYLQLDVYKTDDGKDTTLYVKGNDYAEDDWVLVHVNDVKRRQHHPYHQQGPLQVRLVEIVGEAKCFDGVQSKIYYKADMHTIEGKDYDDAYRFYKNDAGRTVPSSTPGSSISSVTSSVAMTIDNTNYAVLKHIEWTVSDGRLRRRAASSTWTARRASVKVNKIDGISTSTGATSAKGSTVTSMVHSPTIRHYRTGRFRFWRFAIVDDRRLPYVSTSDKYNEDYKAWLCSWSRPTGRRRQPAGYLHQDCW